MNTARARGAVAAGHAVTAGAATEILNEGGTAFDAAIAALAAACVCEPVLASPGGGGFMMAMPAGSQRPILVDFFGHSPRQRRHDLSELEFESVFADFGTARQEFHVGRGATAVPGFVAGLAEIHRRFGTLPLAELMTPAIRAGRNGVEMTEFQSFLFEVVSPILTYSASSRSLFAPDGHLLRTGEKLVNPGLAEFFEAFGKEGPALCVCGAGADAILEGQDASGHLLASDLSEYRIEEREALCLSVNGWDVFLNPPPSAGGTLIAVMLDGITRHGLDRADAIARADRARRRHDGEPDAILAEIGLRSAATPESAGPATRGTTHVSIIDAFGNAAAVTVSNGEGSGHLAGQFGFMPNNLLGEEDLMPRGFHLWTPDARLASNMAPSLMRHSDGRVTALGSGGSNRIRTAVFQVIAGLAVDGLNPREATEAGRVHIEDEHLDFEDLFDDHARDRMRTAFPDHRAWPDRNLFFGGCHTVARDADGTFSGAGDPRRAGVYAEV